jgi:hypothetical protein
MATQDTLRLLLDLALMDGVFAKRHQSPGSKLYELRLLDDVARTGRKIKMSPHMVRRRPYFAGWLDRNVTKTPVRNPGYANRDTAPEAGLRLSKQVNGAVLEEPGPMKLCEGRAVPG